MCVARGSQKWRAVLASADTLNVIGLLVNARRV